MCNNGTEGTRAGIGNLWPMGHIWPVEPLDLPTEPWLLRHLLMVVVFLCHAGTRGKEVVEVAGSSYWLT